MKKSLKIFLPTFFIVTTIAATVIILIISRDTSKKSFRFNGEDILSYCDNDDNTLSWFEDKRSTQIYNPTQQQQSDWDNDVDRAGVCQEVVSQMSDEQLSTDIAHWFCDWWQDYYRSGPSGEFIWFPLDSSWTDDHYARGYQKIWDWQSEFTITINNRKIIEGVPYCSFTINFYNNCWNKELQWSKTQDTSYQDFKKIWTTASLKVANAPIIFETDPTNFHYQINTPSLPYTMEGNSGYAVYYRKYLSTQMWNWEGSGCMGDGNGYAFEVNSFILEKFKLPE